MIDLPHRELIVNRSMKSLLLCLGMCLLVGLPRLALAEEAAAQMSEAERAYRETLAKLDWVKGPTTVDVPGKSKLVVPEGYVFLNQRDTDRYLELNQNPPSGEEVMVGRADLDWVAYLSFSDEGYVKDDEQIDADALLKAR